jgi:hypothetical protein
MCTVVCRESRLEVIPARLWKLLSSFISGAVFLFLLSLLGIHSHMQLNYSLMHLKFYLKTCSILLAQHYSYFQNIEETQGLSFS